MTINARLTRLERTVSAIPVVSDDRYRWALLTLLETKAARYYGSLAQSGTKLHGKVLTTIMNALEPGVFLGNGENHQSTVPLCKQP